MHQTIGKPRKNATARAKNSFSVYLHTRTPLLHGCSSCISQQVGALCRIYSKIGRKKWNKWPPFTINFRIIA